MVLKMLVGFIVLGFMLVQPVFADLHGTDVINNDIRSDAANGFTGVKGKTWTVSDDSASPIDISVSPAGAFEITKGANNTFYVKLVNPTKLLDPLGELISPNWSRLGGAIVELPPETDEVGAIFNTSIGRPIDIEAVRKDPLVKNFKISSNPQYSIEGNSIAEKTKIKNNAIYYKRARGHGLDKVDIILEFTYNGTPRKYTASLPTRDDGYRMDWIPVNNEDYTIITTNLRKFENSGFSFKSEANEDIVGKINNAMKRGCQDNFDNFGPKERYQMIRWSYKPITEYDLRDKPYCSSHRQDGDVTYGCWIHFDPSIGLVSPSARTGGFCRYWYKKIGAVPLTQAQ